jgi:hypothetical protein
MGYFVKNIAKESKKPARVSLSDNPNFIEFEGIKDRPDVPVDIELVVVGKGFLWNEEKEEYENITEFTVVESDTVTEHKFKGTTEIAEVGSNVFYLGPPDADNDGLPAWTSQQIANSLRNCLIKNAFFKSNFNIDVVFNANRGLPEQTNVIHLVSKGAGQKYTFTINKHAEFETTFLKINGQTDNSSIGDTLGEGYNIVDINIDIYKNTGVQLGQDDVPSASLGEYVTTLTKSYSYSPLWFDVNAMNRNTYSSAFLTAEGWCDAGTVNDFRFTAGRVITAPEIYEDSVFYYSDVLYTITGYDRTLEANDLSDYVYDTHRNLIVKPLTRQKALPHVKGQSQYFNFIMSDPDRGQGLREEYEFGILFKLYSQSGKHLADKVRHQKERAEFAIVNTVKLDIDSVVKDSEIAGGLQVGIVEAHLCRDGKAVSEPLKFTILPDYLYHVNDFAFLNSLGGWSSFNFCGTEQTDFKTTSNTIFKTLTPDHTISGEIESVYSKEVSEQFVVQSMPVKRDVADWLKELSASPAVYQLATKRYIVVDEMNIKHNSTDELFRVEMKYHYSDTFNARLK